MAGMTNIATMMSIAQATDTSVTAAQSLNSAVSFMTSFIASVSDYSGGAGLAGKVAGNSESVVAKIEAIEEMMDLAEAYRDAVESIESMTAEQLSQVSQNAGGLAQNEANLNLARAVAQLEFAGMVQNHVQRMIASMGAQLVLETHIDVGSMGARGAWAHFFNSAGFDYSWIERSRVPAGSQYFEIYPEKEQ